MVDVSLWLGVSLLLAGAPLFSPQAGSSQPPAGTPAAPATAQAAPPAFPPDAKLAYVYLSRITNESKDGKAAIAKITALQTAKQADLQKKQEALQAAQQKAAPGGLALADTAREQLEREVGRLQRDLERATEEARADINELSRDLQRDLNRKMLPIIEQVSKQRNLFVVFALEDSALLWYDPALDLTGEVLQRLDAAAAPAAPSKE